MWSFIYRTIIGGSILGGAIGIISGLKAGLQTATNYNSLDEFFSNVICITLNSVDRGVYGIFYGGLFGLTLPVSLPAAIIYGLKKFPIDDGNIDAQHKES